jgi:hypothetical protein
LFFLWALTASDGQGDAPPAELTALGKDLEEVCGALVRAEGRGQVFLRRALADRATQLSEQRSSEGLLALSEGERPGQRSGPASPVASRHNSPERSRGARAHQAHDAEAVSVPPPSGALLFEDLMYRLAAAIASDIGGSDELLSTLAWAPVRMCSREFVAA